MRDVTHAEYVAALDACIPTLNCYVGVTYARNALWKAHSTLRHGIGEITNPRRGLCDHTGHHLMGTAEMLLRHWPWRDSVCYMYPIPSMEPGVSARLAYNKAYCDGSMWSRVTPYGRARWAAYMFLAHACAHYLESKGECY